MVDEILPPALASDKSWLSPNCYDLSGTANVRLPPTIVTASSEPARQLEAPISRLMRVLRRARLGHFV